MNNPDQDAPARDNARFADVALGLAGDGNRDGCRYHEYFLQN